jgi:hypothetical protein
MNCVSYTLYIAGELVDGVSGGSLSGATAARAAVCAIAEQSPDAGDFVRRLVVYTILYSIYTVASIMHFTMALKPC